MIPPPATQPASRDSRSGALGTSPSRHIQPLLTGSTEIRPSVLDPFPERKNGRFSWSTVAKAGHQPGSRTRSPADELEFSTARLSWPATPGYHLASPTNSLNPSFRPSVLAIKVARPSVVAQPRRTPSPSPPRVAGEEEAVTWRRARVVHRGPPPCFPGPHSAIPSMCDPRKATPPSCSWDPARYSSWTLAPGFQSSSAGCPHAWSTSKATAHLDAYEVGYH